MKKIIITETDEGVEVEQFYKEVPDEDWRLLETDNEIQHFGGVVGFQRLFHHGMREMKLKHMHAKRDKV